MVSFYKYMVYASDYITIRDILDTRKINKYEKLPPEIKAKIPLSFDEWAKGLNVSKKKSVLWTSRP